MQIANPALLSRVFTRNALQEWVARGEDPALADCLREQLSGAEAEAENGTETRAGTSNRSVISELYKTMLKSYRNEYIYKNTLLNKLLLGRHSLGTTTALAEVPIEKSKADFILINGRAVVYEIKTELDNLDRLGSQLQDYYRAFDTVCVMTSESNVRSVSAALEHTNAGLCVLTKRNGIRTVKEAVADRSFLSHHSMFKLLRKPEYERILLARYGELPRTTPVRLYQECLSRFAAIDLDSAYRAMLAQLKRRIVVREKTRFLQEVPYEIKSLVYFSEYGTEDYEALAEFLNQPFRR
ncbi:sce7726 family protein [Cohnella fermenti]|uniref:Sce7726 family protein n=1 Tax=Cohnella fermenti TaxID=2565925 RepID=A0A4V3WG34_9BACL|nr:sce7726 family protein [Cohnella fermenti]THF82661.1 sce7726 family protein [Cohnella fermenti]